MAKIAVVRVDDAAGQDVKGFGFGCAVSHEESEKQLICQNTNPCDEPPTSALSDQVVPLFEAFEFVQIHREYAVNVGGSQGPRRQPSVSP